MKPVMKQLVWSVFVPAGVGAVAAALTCAAVMAFLPFSSSSKEAAKPHFVLPLKPHTPPVPVSPPLVRPQTVQTTPPSHLPPVQAPPEAVNSMVAALPSFAPLVRQVIPAVVNISISHDPQDRDNSAEQEQDAASSPAEHASVAPKKHHHTGAAHKKHRLLNHHHMARHHVVRPADDDMTGAGSGFVVDASGIIVTNRHVVGDATRVTVSLSDGRTLPARILGDDPMTDIAVIKVESATRLPCVTWGDSRQVEIGDWVMVAGNPFGFGSSVTAGIVSAVGRDLGIGALDDFMQLDAPINPGNSGGPSFNLHGQVVAVNAAIASPSDGSVGIGFGIPAEIVAPVVEEIEKTGHVEHGWLGVTLNDASSPMWVEDVDSDGAAWKGGLRRKDEILAMGSSAVHDARTVLRSVAAAHPGTVFVFTIRRHGQVKTLSITLGQRPSSDM
ncbi:PDZ domain-containing protein [Saccharibacter sp. EH611]|nr:PDZ domain-containing protein [Saccharibacter sp. EH611]MXV58475.1 PDZ domain-containing protein [Saccharibacter sp. EH70]MXV65981.1 PDZ domain-containing protein [Saccharibacter sp. EH60]